MLAAAQKVIHATALDPLDWIVVVVYGVGVFAVGLYYARRTRNTEEYLVGGRSMRFSSVGVSLFASLFSIITYTAIPGEMINKGPVVLCWMLGLPVIFVVVGLVLIPRIMALPVTSGYELLEKRLGLGNRRLASGIFLATRMLWMAMVIDTISRKVLLVVLGLPDQWAFGVAVAVGLATLAYVFMGGLRAVVHVNVIQAFVLFAAAIATVAMITIKMGGVGAWWPTEWSSTWDHQPLFSWDPTVRVTVVGSIVWMTVWWICTAGSDQMAMQRYLATRDAPAARKAFALTLVSNIFITALLCSLGFALLGFFKAHPEFLRADGGVLQTSLTIKDDADKLFPYYIVRFLPMGVKGLVVASLLATAMAALASGISAACSVVCTDFVDPIAGRATTEQAGLRRNKVIALVIGLLAIAGSYLVSKVSGNTFEVTTRTNHVFIAPLFSLFVMAMFVRFSTPLGAVAGAVSGCSVAAVIAFWDLMTNGLVGLGWITQASPKLSFQWISLIALIVSLVVGILVSLMFPRKGSVDPVSAAGAAEGVLR